MIGSFKINNILILDGTNTSRVVPYTDDKDRLGEVRDMVGGWNPTLGSAGVVKVDAAVALAQLNTTREKLVSLGTTEYSVKIDDSTFKYTAADILRAFDAQYADAKKVKEWFAIAAGFRRFGVLPEVNALRERMGLKPIEEIPADNWTGLSKLEIEKRNLAENLDRSRAKPMTEKDCVHAAYKLLEAGATQSEMRKTFGDGNGQKLWFLTNICRKDKSGQLLKDSISGVVNLAALGQGGSDAVGKLTFTELESGKITLEEACEAIRTAKPPVNKPKMLAKTDIEALAKNSGVELTRYILVSLLNSDKDSINALLHHKVALNKVFEDLKLRVPDLKA